MSTAGNEHAVTFVDPAAALAASAAAARRANAVPPLATPPAAHGGPIPVVYGAFLPPEEGNARGHHATHAPPPPPLRRWDHPNWDQNPFEAFEAEGEFTPATGGGGGVDQATADRATAMNADRNRAAATICQTNPLLRLSDWDPATRNNLPAPQAVHLKQEVVFRFPDRKPSQWQISKLLEWLNKSRHEAGRRMPPTRYLCYYYVLYRTLAPRAR